MTPPDTVVNEWFPVADSSSLTSGSSTPFALLDERLLLMTDNAGTPAVFRDTCPHRGAQLSLGRFDGTTMQCPYHGWEFATDGRCVHQPAHPDRDPPAASGLPPLRTTERYGLVWACLGDDPQALPEYPFFDDYAGLSLVLDPAPLASSGPRIIENFLDLAHFPYVHAGYLGEVPHTAIDRYGVDVVDGVLHLTDVTVWQPNPGPKATHGGPVAYQYSVSHPYAATLTKTPSEVDGGELGGFSILIVASPLTETDCVVWRVVTVRDPDLDTEAQREFNRTIFGQDVAVVESQRPKRLPLDPRAEVHQPADSGSLAYRKWLQARGTRYGVLTSAPDE